MYSGLGMISVLDGCSKKIEGFIPATLVFRGTGRTRRMKSLRAEMVEDQFHRFKRIKANMEVDTNDSAIVQLMDSYETPPSIEEAKRTLEENGFVIEKNDEDD